MPAFADTNVLLYALVAEDHESDKRDIARQILSREDLVLSYQVLVEFCEWLRAPPSSHLRGHRLCTPNSTSSRAGRGAGPVG